MGYAFGRSCNNCGQKLYPPLWEALIFLPIILLWINFVPFGWPMNLIGLLILVLVLYILIGPIIPFKFKSKENA